MKHLHIFLTTLAVTGLAAFAVPTVQASAAAPSSERDVTSIAGAFFTTLPQDSPPVPDTVYEDVNLMGGIQSTPSTGNVPTAVANLDATWYTVADNGDHVVVKYVVAHAEGSDVTFTMDRFLNSATLSATLSGKLCDPDCAPAPNTFTITANWTATGPLIRLLDNTRVVSPHQGVYTSHNRSAQRTATATGTITGAPFTGAFTATDATINTDNYSERLVQH